MIPSSLVLCGALLVAGATAQNVFWVATGSPDRQLIGKDLTGIGDLNQDGYEDLVMIVSKRCTGQDWEAIQVRSGADGTLLQDVSSYGNGSRFYAVTGAGDMNGDGLPDYVASQADLTTAWCEVRSGSTGAVLWSVPGFWDELLSDIDVNGDGQRDLIVGYWRNSNYWGEVRAYSHGGTLLYQLVGGVAGPTHPPLGIGNCFAKLGDVDNDGRDDFVMGCGEPMGRGAGVVVSGATGQYLRVCYGELPGDGIFLLASECGDMDGDGHQDFAMGNGGTPAVIRGVVRVFSGRTGQVLHQWTEPANTWGDGMASRGVDLDGDGISDMAVGYYYYYSPSGTQGAVYAFSGRDGSQIGFLAGQPAQAGATGNVGNRGTSTMRPRVGERIGYILAPNPITNFWSGTWAGNPCGHDLGALVAYRGLPRTAVEFGLGCAGNLATLPNIGMSSLGPSGVRIHLSNAPSDTLAVLLLGLSTTQYGGLPLPMSLDHLGLPGCKLLTSIELMSTAVAGAVGIKAGHAALDVPIPTPASGLGLWTVSAQWWVLGGASTFPGGMSQAIRWQH